MAKRAPGNPQGGLTLGNVPQLPGANFGGPAGDISSALGSFTNRLQELRSDEDRRAFRDAQAELEQQRFEDEQTLTRELGQAQITEQQAGRAATGRREDIRLAESGRTTRLLAAQEATQAELDRASELNIRIGAPQQEDELSRRRSAITQMALTSLAQDRSPETAALLVKETFRLSDEEALIAVQEAQTVLDIREQEIAVKEAGGRQGLFGDLDLDNLGAPIDTTNAPPQEVPPVVSTGGTPGIDPFQQFLNVGQPTGETPPLGGALEEEPSPDDVVDALLAQNMSGTDIVSLFEREGADDEEMEVVKTILRTKGIPFVESQLDATPNAFPNLEGLGNEPDNFLSRLGR